MARILVVEDHREVRDVLREMLEDEGYEVLEAPNGKEAMRLYRTEGADLIITDILMPEKDGLEIITEVRRDFPDVKIIAISAGGRVLESGDVLSTAKMFGAQRTFTIPFDVKEVLDAVRELLGE